jgi:DNA-binding transcriptional ArsR family regulator
MSRQKKDLQEAVGLLKMLSHPVRLSLLCHLLDKGEVSVGELVTLEQGAAGQSQISQFLARMRKEGLVKNRRQGQTVLYSIQSHHVTMLVTALHELYCRPTGEKDPARKSAPGAAE